MREIKFRFYSNHLQKFIVPKDDIFVGALEDPDMNPMQYTGLTDRNGVEIFEGDIVSILFFGNPDSSNEDGIIKWWQPSSAFKWFSLEEDPSDANNYWLSEADERDRAVIGNIYENPELLK